MISAPAGGRSGWSLYLPIAVALAPVLVPVGPGRTAIIDLPNVLALAAFVSAVMLTRQPVRLPFVGPVLLMALGSLIATANAIQPLASILTLIQDAYLFVWFVMLVNVLKERGDFRGLRLTWVWVANAIAIYGMIQALTHANSSLLDLTKIKGARAVGTFDQPDELADYLTMSIFMVLSLNEELGRSIRWGSILLMCAGIVATKSNGGAGSLLAGVFAWAITRAWTRQASFAWLMAGALLAVSVALTGFWLIAGVGLGAAQIRELQSQSFLGRVGHSSEGRVLIWGQLQRRYLRSPLGIGPGNSRWQPVTVEERERPNVRSAETDPFLSKEAHNDYLAYLVERGPLALLAMLALKFQVFSRITRWWRRRSLDRSRPLLGGAMAAAFVGAWVASMLNSNTIETLHFRHVWLFLGMVCALDAAAAQGANTDGGGRSVSGPLASTAVAT